MRLIDADEAKKLQHMLTLKPSERALFRLMLDRMPTYDLPNSPLSIEELREMTYYPVWVERHDFAISEFAIVKDTENPQFVSFVTVNGGIRLPCSVYGRNWLAYRRKPEEDTENAK